MVRENDVKRTMIVWSVAVLVGGLAVSNATAQIPIPRVPAPGAMPGDSADTVTVDPFRFDPPVSPLGAMGRSLLLPGWGQSVMNRRATGAFFVFWEGISLAMTLKSHHQLQYMKRVEHEAVEAKRQEYEDWLVLLVFNHLVAGAEAFVSAYLWDFPEEIHFQAGPSSVGVRGVIPLRR